MSSTKNDSTLIFFCLSYSTFCFIFSRTSFLFSYSFSFRYFSFSSAYCSISFFCFYSCFSRAFSLRLRVRAESTFFSGLLDLFVSSKDFSLTALFFETTTFFSTLLLGDLSLTRFFRGSCILPFLLISVALCSDLTFSASYAFS